MLGHRIEAVRKERHKIHPQPPQWSRLVYHQLPSREPQTVERIQKTLANTNNKGYIACCERCGTQTSATRSPQFPSNVGVSATNDPARPAKRWQVLAKKSKEPGYVELDAATCPISSSTRSSRRRCPTFARVMIQRDRIICQQELLQDQLRSFLNQMASGKSEIPRNVVDHVDLANIKSPASASAAANQFGKSRPCDAVR